MSKQDLPIVCDLNALPDRAAHEALGSDLFARTQSATAIDGGYRLVFPVGALSLLAQFIDGERRCCPFLRFAVVVEPAAETVSLVLSGPDGTSALLAAELLPHLPEGMLEPPAS